jgi:hypothetical protein
MLNCCLSARGITGALNAPAIGDFEAAGRALTDIHQCNHESGLLRSRVSALLFQPIEL